MSRLTKQQVLQLLTMTTANFPGMQEKELGPTAELWLNMLGDIPFDVLKAAIVKVLATAKFWPTVAEIREAAVSLLPKEVPDAEEAWGEVLRHMKQTGYMRLPEWSHPVVGKTVEAMWGSWANACASVTTDNLSVDRAQFLRMYSTMTKREREAVLLPPGVREMVKQVDVKGSPIRLFAPADHADEP